MEKPTYEQYLADPAVYERIYREASRARAEAMGRLLFAPVARLCARLASVRIGMQPPPHASS